MAARKGLRTKGLVIVSALSLLGGLAACSAPESTPSRSPAGSESPAPALEKSAINIALTGVGTISNVPLYLAQELGYFADAGLTVKMTAVKGGSDAIQSLITNTVDATTNEYVHTISVQQQKKDIEAVMVIQDAPTYALVVTSKNANATIKDLEGFNIGVVSLGGSTENLVNYLFEKNGMEPSKAKLIAIGVGQSQSAAIQSGNIQALIATEPTLTTALDAGTVKVLVDFRTPDVIKEMFGGPSPFWSVLMTNEFAQKNPNTTQALVTACARALDFMHSSSVDEVVAKLPGEVYYPSGDKTIFTHILNGGMSGFSKDGVMPTGGPQNILNYLKQSDPTGDISMIDLEKTFDDTFAKTAAK